MVTGLKVSTIWNRYNFVGASRTAYEQMVTATFVSTPWCIQVIVPVGVSNRDRDWKCRLFWKIKYEKSVSKLVKWPYVESDGFTMNSE